MFLASLRLNFPQSGKEGSHSRHPHLPVVDVPGVDTAEDFASSMPTACGGSPPLDTLAGAERLPQETAVGLEECNGPTWLLWESQSTEPKLEVGFWPPGRSEEGGMPGRGDSSGSASEQKVEAGLRVFGGTGGGGWRRVGGAGPRWVGAQGLPQVQQGWAAFIAQEEERVGSAFAWVAQIPPR